MQHDISGITSSLKAKFSKLALIPDELLPTGSEDFYYLLAKRNLSYTLAVNLLTKHVNQVLICLEQTVPSALQEFLDNNKSILLDIDSVTNKGLWRFYIYADKYNTKWISNKFSQTNIDNKELEGLGFYFDPRANKVTQYKYYWFDLKTGLETRQRFSATGQFLNSQDVVFSGLSSNIENNQFGIDNINTAGCMLKYSYCSELNQQYITITKDTRNDYTEYNKQSGGGCSIVAAVVPNIL